MKDAFIFNQEKQSDGMVQVFADMQMNYLAQSHCEPCNIEVDIIKEFGEYRATLLFTCSNFSFVTSSKSWSPYKAIEMATVIAREEIMQRHYNSYTYA